MFCRVKAVFKAHCSSCPQIWPEEGNSIGPGLTDIGKKFGKEELLDAVIHPGAAIVFGYEPWLINTKDGSSVFGFLVSENKPNCCCKRHRAAKDT
jgi:putative heme-binding domain-containing protein